MTNIERKRQQLQATLDSDKTLEERNKMGQFSTPYPLARQICEYMKTFTGDHIESFLEPSMGTGVFFSSLSEISEIGESVGYEIDTHYFNPTKELWKKYNIQIINEDFLDAVPDKKFSLIITNPPYSRHHHIPLQIKHKLSETIKSIYGIKLSALAGLHIYFIILATQWLKDDGYSCWLIPSEFLSVNYGADLKSFLLKNVDLVSIHSYDNSDLQFSDALVSSSILVFRKSKNKNEYVKFSWGANINNPDKTIIIKKTELNPIEKWNYSFLLNRNAYAESKFTIGTFFNIKRGIATGDNSFFILNKKTIDEFDIPLQVLSPLIPPPRKLQSKIYTKKNAKEDSLYLLSSHETISTIKEQHIGLYEYLEKGISDGVHLRANCKNRDPWYGLEKRPSAPILVSYMGRDTNTSDIPIKFILNLSDGIATNSYLCLYPKDEYLPLDKDAYKNIWNILSSIPKDVLLAFGRSYGGGLLKWEPKELGLIPCPMLAEYFKPRQASLFDNI